MSPRRPPSPAAPIDRIASPDDVESLRAWALASLANGRGREAVACVADMPSAYDALDAPKLDVETEVRVRTGIAEEDVGLILTAVALGDVAYKPAPRALLARAIGAEWLVRRSVSGFGPSARFHQARSMIGIARTTAHRALAGVERLTPEQHAELAVTLRGLYTSACRPPYPVAPARLRRRELPRSLREARDLLATGRDLPPRDAERQVRLFRAVVSIGHACEPTWPALGGPWWSSQAFGLIVDVSAPRDEPGRQRFALADCLLELEDLPSMGGIAETAYFEDATLLDRAFTIAEAALTHAARSGLPAP